VAHKNKPLTQADKRKQIADILRVSPQLSSRKIAELVGVSPTTVSKIRKEFTDKTVQSGQMDTQAEEWNTYIRENPDILVVCLKGLCVHLRTLRCELRWFKSKVVRPAIVKGSCIKNGWRQIKTPPLQ
jgi:predicted transcriptional regulator